MGSAYPLSFTPLGKKYGNILDNDSFTHAVALTLTYCVDFITLDKEL